MSYMACLLITAIVVPVGTLFLMKHPRVAGLLKDYVPIVLLCALITVMLAWFLYLAVQLVHMTWQ